MRILFLLTSLISCYTLMGQSATDTINNQVWKVFSHAYSTHDPQLFQSIHCADLVRVSGNGKSILSAEEYFNRNEKSFSKRKTRGQQVEISFRFLDRFVDGKMASEQGIYQLVIVKSDGSINHYYGQFHVLLRRDLEKWRIFMDYDANPNNEIGLDQFLSAKP